MRPWRPCHSILPHKSMGSWSKIDEMIRAYKGSITQHENHDDIEDHFSTQSSQFKTFESSSTLKISPNQRDGWSVLMDSLLHLDLLSEEYAIDAYNVKSALLQHLMHRLKISAETMSRRQEMSANQMKKAQENINGHANSDKQFKMPSATISKLAILTKSVWQIVKV